MMTVTYIVAVSGVPPDVLIDPDRGDTIKPVRAVDQLGADGQERIRGGVPCHAEVGRRSGRSTSASTTIDVTATMIASRDSFPFRRRRRRDAVTPDPSTRPAPVARNHHLQDRRFPSERHMHQPAQHRIVSDPRPGAARTRKRRCRGAAAQHSVVGFDVLGGHGQPETVQTAERIEAGWGSVSHKGPWVFRCGVDTLILPTRGPASRHQARPNSSPITHRLL